MFKASHEFIILSVDGSRAVKDHLEEGQRATALSIVDHYMGRPDSQATSLAPVSGNDRCVEGWTDTGSENEPSFNRKRLSLQRKESKESKSNPWWTYTLFFIAN